jgi:predicted lipoprotein with Yx(FWY)xxD motif
LRTKSTPFTHHTGANLLRVRSTIALLATIACAAGVTAAVATAGTAHPATTNHNVTLSVKKTSIGKILVQNGGLIVYMFTKDKRGEKKNTCPASNGCASVWPPLLGTVKVGAGVKKSLIGYIKDGSQKQVTYNGYPLYGYNLNSTSISYVSVNQFGGDWNALSASGAQVKYQG